VAEKKIGTRWFKAGDVLATDALRLQVRMVKLLGPAADSLHEIFAPIMLRSHGTAPADSPLLSALEVASDAASIKALGQIVAHLDADDVVTLFQDILNLGLIAYDAKGPFEKIDLDQEFSGSNARDLFPVILFVLKETLGDFFSGVLASGRPTSPAKR
jgi:hypothetical protein